MTIDPRQLQEKIEFESETLENVLERYSGFGNELLNQLPDKAEYLKDPDTNDVWGFVEGKYGFQIDPECEVIITWGNAKEFQEFGTWFENPVELAVEQLKKFT